MRFRYSLVSKCFVYDGTHAAQSLGEQVPRLLRASNQNPQVFNPAGLFKFLDYFFSDEFRRLQFHMEVKLRHPLGGCGSDRRNLCSANFAGVIVKFEENFEESVDPIHAGENDPVIRMRVLHQFGEVTKITRWFDSNGGQLDYIRPEFTQLRAQFSGLLARSRHHDSLPKERTLLEPV